MGFFPQARVTDPCNKETHSQSPVETGTETTQKLVYVIFSALWDLVSVRGQLIIV